MTTRAAVPARVWVEAARPKTLPAAVAPVLVGTAAAERFVAWRLAATLVVGLSVQVAVNYANDYFDAAHGVDTGERVGPRRAVAAGLVAPAAMRRAMVLTIAVAGCAALALAVAVGWEFLAVGLVCVLALLGYSGGPKPYASAGLGEVFVFVFFGLVATVGSAYAQDERIVPLAVVAAVPIGLLATAILVINNLRDIATDRAAGKRTLAVRLGDRGTRWLYTVLVLAPFVLSVIALETWLPLLTAGLAVPLLAVVIRGATGRDLVPALAGTGALELSYGILLAVALWMR